jgi:hypothetical protein
MLFKKIKYSKKFCFRDVKLFCEKMGFFSTINNLIIRGAWVTCEPWFTGSQTLGEPWVIGEP